MVSCILYKSKNVGVLRVPGVITTDQKSRKKPIYLRSLLLFFVFHPKKQLRAPGLLPKYGVS